MPLHGAAVHINAYNFPVWGMLEKLGPTLLAGVPAIVKPATATAYVTEAAVRILIEGNVLPKKVEIGALHGSLRVIRTGLEPTDRVVVDGLVRAQAGTKVPTQPGAIRFASEGGQQG